MRICSGAGCLRVVPDDVRFCDDCRPEHFKPKQDDGIKSHGKATEQTRAADRDTYAFLYSSHRW